MKPPPFDYVRAEDLDHALATLAEHGDDAKPVAGGQSLVPLLNLRLARPEVLVDLNDVALDRVDLSTGRLRTEALVRHRTLCVDATVASANPLLHEAASYIGHAAIRNRGTVGGSLAHADPAAELALVAVATGADVEVRSASGAREVSASEFFQGPFMTTLDPDEVVVAVTWPALAEGDRWGFAEVAERSGDFAAAAAAVVMAGDEVSLAAAGVAGRPVRLPETEAALAAGAATDELRRSIRAEVDRIADGSREPHVLRLVEHTVVEAIERANTSGRNR